MDGFPEPDARDENGTTFERFYNLFMAKKPAPPPEPEEDNYSVVLYMYVGELMAERFRSW